MNIDKKDTDSTDTTSVATTTIPSSDIVATITLPDGLPQETVYNPSIPAIQIIEDSTAASHIELEPYYREEITETLERSKGLLNGGIKLSFKLPDALGGVQFEFERKPKEETRKITKEVYKPKK